MIAKDIAKITQSATDACTNYLRSALMDGKYSEGESIVIDRLAIETGLSPTPVREAVRRLEAEGFLSFIPKKGALVRPVDPKEFEQLVQIRIALEPILLKHAMIKTNKTSIKVVSKALNNWISKKEPTAILTSQWNFYSAIYSLANQQRIFDLVESNWKHIHRYHRIAWIPSASTREKDIALMSALFEHFSNKDINRTQKALLKVINWGTNIVSQQLANRSNI